MRVSLRESGWDGNNRRKLESFIDQYAGQTAAAVFDWDNTVIKNDIGDAFFAHLLEHDLIKTPSDWAQTSEYLTLEAISALEKRSHAELGSIYFDSRTLSGAKAFKDFDATIMEPSYAWLTQLLAGYTEAEIKEIAVKVIDTQLSNHAGSTKSLAGREIPDYIRVYPQILELVDNFASNGIKVMVSSASPEIIVKAFAERIAIPADNVIGVRCACDKNGVLTSRIEGVMNYRRGKVIRLGGINYAFAAGDSDGDTELLGGASVLRLVIDRLKGYNIAKTAAENRDGKWLLNRQFM